MTAKVYTLDVVTIMLDSTIGEKATALRAICEAMFVEGEYPRDERQLIYQRFLEREQLGSTYLGSGAALPHVRIPSLSTSRLGKTRLAICVAERPVAWEPHRAAFVQVICAMLVHEPATEEHLSLLAALASWLHDRGAMQRLIEAQDCDRLVDIVKKDFPVAGFEVHNLGMASAEKLGS